MVSPRKSFTRALKWLSGTSAAGLDGISPLLLKRIGKETLEHLRDSLNYAIKFRQHTKGIQPGPPLEQPLEQMNPRLPLGGRRWDSTNMQGTPPNWREVELTKRRLEHWWPTRNPPGTPEESAGN
ncbi:hypothetical protein MRX96_000725 [Rhipicephalus microplus]